mgnify:CR=1 FL=1|jgi:methylmalonyl-CoA/ethylmalonyl-CoA epimerase
MKLKFRVKINHIGIATSNYKQTAAFYLALGYRKTIGGYDQNQNVYGYFYEAVGMPTIELLSPFDENSPINKVLEKNGVIPYHLCYELIDIELDDAIKNLRENKFVLISQPTISISLGNRRVCFLFHKDVGIIELLEHE